MATLADLVGGGMPAAPQGTLPIGAVDAPPGTKLYELAQRQAAAARPPPRRRDNRADVFASLASKFTPGNAMPGEGMVPFGDMPPQAQALMGKAWGQPLVGVDPGTLNGQERQLLEHLRHIGKQQVSARVDANPMYAARMPRGT